MRTKQTKTETITRFVTTCDICGENAGWMRTCCVCKKDLCFKHATEFYYSGGDNWDHIACPDHKNIVQEAYNKRRALLEAIPEIEDIIKEFLSK
jgi:hypothetical protein